MLQNNILPEIVEIEPCNDCCEYCLLNYADILGQNFLFNNLTPAEISHAIKQTHHKVKVYSKDDTVLKMGDSCCDLLIIVKGSVIAEIIDFEGRVLRVEEIKAPETVSPSNIFGDENIFDLNIISVEDTIMLRIRKQDLVSLFKMDDRILYNFLKIMSNRSQKLSKQIRILGLHTIKGKIASVILDVNNKTGENKFRLPYTQQELADMFGSTRPSVARAIRDMDKDGLLRAKGKSIEIMNRAALSNLLR